MIKEDSLPDVSEKLLDLSTAEIPIFEELNPSGNFLGLKAKDGILILDSTGMIRDVNITACELMGFGKNELLGVSIEYFFIEALFFINSDWDKSKVNSICFEKSLFNSQRRIIDAEINIYHLDNDKILVIVKDNSELKKASEQNQKIFEELKFNRDLLEEQSAELVKLSEELSDSEERLKGLLLEKDKIFSIIAHDIKSPFTGLIGLSSILCDEYDSIEKDKLKQYLVHMDNLIKNQFRLIENLLEWSRLQSGKMKCLPVKINILDSLNYMLGLISQNAENKSITLINKVAENIFVIADEQMLNSILENVLVNAIKFTKIGGRIIIDSVFENDVAGIAVKDFGTGIDPSILQNIFRIDIGHSSLGTEKEKGTGLGLIICKEMIDKQNGSIEIKSNLGEGTEVIITLPVWKTLDALLESDLEINMVI